jgi:Multicopper oxidase
MLRPICSQTCRSMGSHWRLSRWTGCLSPITIPITVRGSQVMSSCRLQDARARVRDARGGGTEGTRNMCTGLTVTFTGDSRVFISTAKRYSSADAPMTHVHVGGYQYWRIVNKNARGSPFHIYRVHFLYYAANEHRPSSPKWLDTANVPVEGSLDLIMDFTDPIIRGVSLFHCHLLSHEDKGMMAKIALRACLCPLLRIGNRCRYKRGSNSRGVPKNVSSGQRSKEAIPSSSLSDELCR